MISCFAQIIGVINISHKRHKAFATFVFFAAEITLWAFPDYTVPFPTLHCALLGLTLCSISKRLWGFEEGVGVRD